MLVRCAYFAACLAACWFALPGCVRCETAASRGKSDAGAALATSSGSDAGEKRASFLHLLVAYKGAARAPASITRTKQEARARARELLLRARGGENFEQLIMEQSDDQVKHQYHGYTGPIPQEGRFLDFTTTGFSLKPGQIAGRLAETPYGYHVIKRID
jgi:hypothetical protein